jgi:hypothetical protein
LTAQAGYRAIEDRSALHPLAKVPDDLRSKARIGRLAHQPQHLLNALFGDKAEKG